MTAPGSHNQTDGDARKRTLERLAMIRASHAAGRHDEAREYERNLADALAVSRAREAELAKALILITPWLDFEDFPAILEGLSEAEVFAFAEDVQRVRDALAPRSAATEGTT